MEFIPNIDDANTEVSRLEKELGLSRGAFIPNIDDANARIEELEKMGAGKVSKKAAAPNAVSKPAPQTVPLKGLARAIAANQPNQPKAQRAATVPVEPPVSELRGLRRAIAANISAAQK